MQRLCRRRLVVAAGVLAIAGACQPPEQPELRGSLYFGAGQYLARLDLRNGSTSVVANIGNVDVQEISPHRDDRLLLTVLGSVNHQPTHQLVLYDLASRQTLTLANGRHGRYLPGTDVLVYDDGTNIVVAERAGADWNRTRVQGHAFNARVSILPVSPDRFLFAVADGPVMSWDVVTRQASQLGEPGRHCDLERALWLVGYGQIVCGHREQDDTYRYSLLGLDGTVEGSLSLPAGKQFRPIAWLPDQGVIVLTEAWRSWFSDRAKAAIWAYRPDSQDAYRLVDDQYVGDFAVYERS